MTIERFMEKYRVEPITRIEGWGVALWYTLYDKEKGEKVAFEGDVYGEFLRFKTMDEAFAWAIEQERNQNKKD